MSAPLVSRSIFSGPPVHALFAVDPKNYSFAHAGLKKGRHNRPAQDYILCADHKNIESKFRGPCRVEDTLTVRSIIFVSITPAYALSTFAM